MKKLLVMLTIFALSIVSLKSSAQVSSFVGTASNPTIAIQNARIDTANFTMSGAYNAVVTMQVLATRTSGTMAGTVRLYGSNYDNITGAWQPVGDTMTLTNAATNQFVWTLSQPCFKYYRVLQSGGTTVQGLLQIKVFGIKPN